MHLWLYDETLPFSFSLADELTTAAALLVARCAMWDQDDEPEGRAEVVDLAAVRASRERS